MDMGRSFILNCWCRFIAPCPLPRKSGRTASSPLIAPLYFLHLPNKLQPEAPHRTTRATSPRKHHIRETKMDIILSLGHGSFSHRDRGSDSTERPLASPDNPDCWTTRSTDAALSGTRDANPG